ncbi:Hypothetical protein NTJ_09334 [Nesidiocoris tenuis]|uniref:Pecanex-like protein n=1 Tax=Nesidiocoris tenuis TaxID=355587 RepID=A0ABN7AWI0_9HEMI|nr:Hypothetical protein NTJ_09334 [Nesidiocoris tenuis]
MLVSRSVADAEPIRSTTTQRSQSIHHKAPVKIAVIATSTPKTLSGSQLKKKPGNKGGVYKPIHRPPQMPTQHPQEVIVNVNPGDIDEHEVVGPKGHKQKGVKKYKIKGLKKLRKYMLPLLLAYKLKFFTLVPLLLGGLVLIVASTGFAGFFFALFAVGVGLKKDH